MMGRSIRDRRWLRTAGTAAIAAGVVAFVLGLVPTTSPHHSSARSSARRHEPRSTTVAPVQAAAPATEVAAPDPATNGLIAVTPPGVPADVHDPSTVATATVSTLPLYASPTAASPVEALPNRNYLGAPLVLLVADIQGSWIETYLPQRPNGSTAWVPASDVTLSSAPCHISVSIVAHQLVLYCNNAQVFDAPVATGAPDSPTPTGSFFVAYIVRLTDPGGAYGPYALGTSAFSNTYYSFEGGPGQIGIHGTNQPWVVGSYASHGCIRLYNNDITTLAQQIVPGTPIEIGP